MEVCKKLVNAYSSPDTPGAEGNMGLFTNLPLHLWIRRARGMDQGHGLYALGRETGESTLHWHIRDLDLAELQGRPQLVLLVFIE